METSASKGNVIRWWPSCRSGMDKVASHVPKGRYLKVVLIVANTGDRESFISVKKWKKYSVVGVVTSEILTFRW